MVRNSARGCCCNRHRDSCDARRGFVHPHNWNNTSHLTRRLLFLLVTLALTAGPTFYIAIVENQPGAGVSLTLILGIAQFFISIGATLLCGIMPSGRMFGDRAVGKLREYLASHTFTASYPILLHSQACNPVGTIEAAPRPPSRHFSLDSTDEGKNNRQNPYGKRTERCRFPLARGALSLPSVINRIEPAISSTSATCSKYFRYTIPSFLDARIHCIPRIRRKPSYTFRSTCA
jgi:hypothetical protein